MTICPKCGKENTSLFSDTVDKTHGYHCDDCNIDFGVDDGKKINNYESLLSEFYYKKIDKDSTVHEVSIKKIGSSSELVLTLIKDNVKTVSNTIDFSSYFESFKKLLFENLFILDWQDSTNGIILENNNESYELEIKFRLGLLPTIKKDGINSFPPYEIALERILLSLFEGM